jgi:hypothetical protein
VSAVIVSDADTAKTTVKINAKTIITFPIFIYYYIQAEGLSLQPEYNI